MTDTPTEEQVLAAFKAAFGLADRAGFSFHVDGEDLDVEDQYGDYITTIGYVTVD